MEEAVKWVELIRAGEERWVDQAARASNLANVWALIDNPNFCHLLKFRTIHYSTHSSKHQIIETQYYFLHNISSEAWNYCDFLYQTLNDSINGSGSWIHLEQCRQTCNTLHPTRSIRASTLIIVRSAEQLRIRPHSGFLFISCFDNFSRSTFQHVQRVRHCCCWL